MQNRYCASTPRVCTSLHFARHRIRHYQLSDSFQVIQFLPQARSFLTKSIQTSICQVLMSKPCLTLPPTISLRNLPATIVLRRIPIDAPKMIVVNETVILDLAGIGIGIGIRSDATVKGVANVDAQARTQTETMTS